MTVAMIGTNIGWLSFSVGVFSTCIIFSITGIYIMSYTRVFLSFILRSIPVLLILSLPLLNYFQLTQIEVFNFTPIYGPLQLIIKGIEGGDGASWPLYIATTIWVLLLYFFAYHRFVKRIVKEVT
jgi:fluoroquinolone transport system permease protein